MASKSPLKGRPLRNPGQGLDEELQRLWDDRASTYFWFAAVFVLLAGMEWLAYLWEAPRQPKTFTVVAIAISLYSGLRLMQLSRLSKRLKLGRDGERAVGQFLEGLRVHGARIFHDVPAEGFNLDHVVIAQQGMFVVETKTWSKPHPEARVTFDGSTLRVAGRAPDRDPIQQVRSEIAWLTRMLEESTGRRFPVRGAVVFPGWFVEPMTAEAKREVWVLEPKALPAFIEREDAVIAESDVALAAYHLSRYVRSSDGSGGG